MPSIKRAVKYFLQNRNLFCDSLVKNVFSFLPDKIYLSLRYRFIMRRKINWENPRYFTEKIQVLKLINRNPLYTTMVDKYAVKQYVSDIFGPEYIIPTLGIWDSPDEIDWAKLPNQFVLKTTHGGGGGGVVICRNKEHLDILKAKEKLNLSLKFDIYREFREWPYKNVPRKVIAEQYMESTDYEGTHDLTDYKFYCFNGEPKYCQVIRDRNSCETIDFYDMKWQHQDFIGLNPNVSNGLKSVSCPKQLLKMIEMCQVLSQGIPFLRVDLYEINGKVYFGELTFFPASGYGAFSPSEWDEILGRLINI